MKEGWHILFGLLMTLLTISQTISGHVVAPMLENVICNDKNEAEISWKPQGDTPALSYTIQYNFTSVSTKSEEYGEIEVTPPVLNKIVQMKPWASYSFRVIANTENGSFPSEHSKTCESQPDVPFRNPENVKVEVQRPTELLVSWTPTIIEPNKLLVSWTPIDETEYNGPNLHYNVFWKKDSPLASWESKDIFDSTASQYTIENLPIFKKYLVKVSTVNQLGSAKGSAEEVVVYSGQSLEMPQNFEKAELINNTCALLRWAPASFESLRADLRGFKIRFRPMNEGDESIREILLEIHVTEFNLTDLKPFTEHYVWLSEYNSTDNGPSAMLNLDTTNEAPSMVENLKAQVLGSYAILLNWEEPLKPNGRITRYRVYYSTVERANRGVRRQLSLKDSLATSIKASNLRSNTNYRFIVVAENTFGLGQEYFIEAKTQPSDGTPELSKPNFSWEPVTSMKIVWQAINDGNAGTYFYVQYRKKGELDWKRTDEEYDDDFLIIKRLHKNSTYQFRVVSGNGRQETESDIQEFHTA